MLVSMPAVCRIEPTFVQRYDVYTAIPTYRVYRLCDAYATLKYVVNYYPIRFRPHSCGRSSTCEGANDDGLLIVENVNGNDEGFYLCTAEVHGVTASAVCKVTVGGT